MKALVVAVVGARLIQRNALQLDSQIQIESEVQMAKLARTVGKYASSEEVQEAKHQTEKISHDIQSLLQNISSQKTYLSQLKEQSMALTDSVKVIENACPKVGAGIPETDGREVLEADQEKPRDMLQGGEEYSEHAEIDWEQPKQETLSIAQVKREEFSQLEQVQQQINLIATMIPTIHDGKKRNGLIKSIAPILEESLDGLLKSLKDADEEEAKEKITSKVEETALDSDEEEEETNSSASKTKLTIKDNPRSEGYIRRKKTITHEKQKGDHIERIKSVEHEEQGGAEESDGEIDIEDEEAEEQKVKSKKKDKLRQRKESKIEEKIAEKNALEARLKELSVEITASEHIMETEE